MRLSANKSSPHYSSACLRVQVLVNGVPRTDVEEADDVDGWAQCLDLQGGDPDKRITIRGRVEFIVPDDVASFLP